MQTIHFTTPTLHERLTAERVFKMLQSDPSRINFEYKWEKANKRFSLTTICSETLMMSLEKMLPDYHVRGTFIEGASTEKSPTKIWQRITENYEEFSKHILKSVLHNDICQLHVESHRLIGEFTLYDFNHTAETRYFIQKLDDYCHSLANDKNAQLTRNIEISDDGAMTIFFDSEDLYISFEVAPALRM